MAATRPADGRAAARHPLDPLSADEIRHAVAILRRDRGVGPRWRFGWIELAEPPKQAVRDPSRGESGERAADVVCWSRDDGRAYKARVSLGGDRVLAWEHCPGVQPNFTVDEYNTCNEALKKDPRVIAALARHGIRDMLYDSIAALGLMIAFYYGLTGYACAIYYRREIFSSVEAFVAAGLLPFLGGAMLTYIIVKSVMDFIDPGKHAILGVSAPLGIAIIFTLLGLVALVLQWRASPAFFRRKA